MNSTAARTAGVLTLTLALFLGFSAFFAPTALADGAKKRAVTISWSEDQDLSEGDQSSVSGSFKKTCKKRVIKLLKLKDGEWANHGRIILKGKFTDFSFTFFHNDTGEQTYRLAMKSRPACGPKRAMSSTSTYVVE